MKLSCVWLQASDSRFINASVEFDLATLKPTYRLLWGEGGLSNALAVAEGLGFDPKVVQRARDIARKGQVIAAATNHMSELGLFGHCIMTHFMRVVILPSHLLVWVKKRISALATLSAQAAYNRTQPIRTYVLCIQVTCVANVQALPLPHIAQDIQCIPMHCFVTC